MKKVILMAAVCFAVASCGKDRTCTCTNTSSYNGISATTTSTRTLVDVSKGQAKANCISTAATYTDGSSYSSDCKLN